MSEARNHRLEQAMADAGLSQKALARAVRKAALKHGRRVGTDHTSVARWLNGMRPRQDTPLYVAEALSERIGRTVTPADLGLAENPAVSPQLGLRYLDDEDDAVAALATLWRADAGELPAVVDSPIDGAAWTEASLRWLTGTRGRTLDRTSATVRVGVADIEAIRTTVDHFADLDNRHGGGLGRRALLRFLSDDVAPLLNGRFSESTGKSLFSAVAEATLLAAWMSYDSGLHGLAQRHFTQALRLADVAEDRQLGASILSAMSHQATFLGRFREGASLARAALAGAGAASSGTLRAQFHAMEARALAGAGEATICDQALADAVSQFERRTPDLDPAWIAYFDLPELTAEIVHCERDLRRPTRAIQSPVAALGHDGGRFARSDFFAAMALAEALLAADRPEEACELAEIAVAAGDTVKSARCASYVRSFRRALQSFDSEQLRQQLDRFASYQLWNAGGPAA